MRNCFTKKMTLGLALGALTLGGAATSAQAQDAMAMDEMKMDAGMGMSAMSMQPMAVSGSVLRYYVDRSGFVTAMDVQTADGVKMVRFSPGMAQRLTAAYPVGSMATVYVMEAPAMGMKGMMRYDMVGMGEKMPEPSAMMMPYMVTDVDMLKSEPYTTIGAKLMEVEGDLTGYIADDMGQVLGLVLDGKTVVRVPNENRLIGSMSASPRKSPLFKNARVMALGYPEAPRYGSVSPYEKRLIATAITVNGQAVGPLGFGMLPKKSAKPLLGFNLNLPMAGSAPEEMQANSMGYMTYKPMDSSMMMPQTMNSSEAMSGTTGTMGTDDMK